MKTLLFFVFSLFLVSCSVQEEEHDQLSILKKGELIMGLLQEHNVEVEELDGINLSTLNPIDKKRILGEANLDSIYAMLKFVDIINRTTFKTPSDINYIPLTRGTNKLTIRGNAEEEEKKNLELELGYSSDKLYVLGSKALADNFSDWQQKSTKASSFSSNTAKAGAEGTVEVHGIRVTFYMTGYVNRDGTGLTDGLVEHFRTGDDYWNNI